MRTILAITILVAGVTAQAKVNPGMCERDINTNKYQSNFIEKLTGQLESSKDPILDLYRQERRAPSEAKATGISGNVADLKNAALAALTTDAFPKNCINASMLSHSYADSYFCPDSSAKKQRASVQKEEFCVSQEQVDYTHWLINKVYSCFNDPQNSLDPRLIFLKINNESGFDHTVCSSAGCGLGQLTPIAIKQLGEQKGIEYFIPPDIDQTIQGNPLKNGCEKLTQLIYPENKRFNSYAGYKASSTNAKCRLLHPGQGAALNAMYSLGYLKYLTRRDGELKDSLALIDNKRAEVKGKLMAASLRLETAKKNARKSRKDKELKSLAVAKADFKKLQEQDAELEDPRWEQQLLMAAYNQGSGGAGALAVDGKLELNRYNRDRSKTGDRKYKEGIYKSLKLALDKTGQGKAPINDYIASVAARLKYIAPNQAAYTKEVFESKRLQVNANSSQYGLDQCSLSTDQDRFQQTPIPLTPIASHVTIKKSSAFLKKSTRIIAMGISLGIVAATNILHKNRAPASLQKPAPVTAKEGAN
jgi:hypothetical protein